MLTGYFEYSLDEKGRFRVCSAWATRLGTEAKLVLGPEQCIWLVDGTYWDELADVVRDPVWDAEGRKFQRVFFGSTADGCMDSQGRVTIPQAHRLRAGITREIVVVGAGLRAEIWDRARWNEYSETVTSDEVVKIAAQMSRKS